MKKLLLFLGITLFIFSLATVALAGGYNPYEEGTKYTTKPHGDGSGSFYNNSTNFCKTCHAVHLAGEPGYKPGTSDPLGDTWRLLRATSPEDACDYCHRGAGAHTNLVVYQMYENAQTDPTKPYPKGEHTLGATVIPDSNLNNPNGTTGTFADGGGLTCNRCHSVHGADILSSTGEWDFKILRNDPAGNGGNVSAQGLKGITEPGYYDTGLTTFSYEIMTAFCGDCHNINPNWTNSSDARDNPHSHPINTDGRMQINNQIDPESGLFSIGVSANGVNHCGSCHSASGGNPPYTGDFPHQTVGHKLLDDWYVPLDPDHPNPADPWYTGEPQRQLPNMDTVCLKCHLWDSNTKGVGVTF